MDNLSKQCNNCKDIFPLTNFHKNSNHKDGKSNKCKFCVSKYSKLAERRRNIRDEAIRSRDGISKRYAQDRLSYYKSRAKKKNIPFNIDSNYLVALWKKQSGKCGYTHTKMVFQKGAFTFYSPSLDKINPHLGYVKGNVLWVLHGVNNFKQQLSLFEFETFIKKCTWDGFNTVEEISKSV